MAEVPNVKILERYRDLLAARTHDVIVRDAAIEMLEKELEDAKAAQAKSVEESESLKRNLGRANDLIKDLRQDNSDLRAYLPELNKEGNFTSEQPGE